MGNKKKKIPIKLPTHDDLDQISDKHPIIISRYCQHVHVLNRQALILAGLWHPSNCNAEIMPLDAAGYPVGILFDRAADQIMSIIPNRVARLSDLKSLLKQMASMGLTGCHTVRGIDYNLDESVYPYITLCNEKSLPVRINVSMDDMDLLIDAQHYNNEKIKAGFFKIYLDGSLGSRGAALSACYSDLSNVKGSLNYTQERLNSIVSSAYDKGLQIGFHCIGDLAIEQALVAIENILIKDSTHDPRFRLVHASVMTPELLKRCKRLPVIIDCQPQFVSSDITWLEKRLGKTRSEYTFAYRKLLDAGITLTGGSDSPVESFNPFLGIWSAVNRKDINGFPKSGWYPQNCCTVYEALCMYTKNAAIATFEEDIKGTLSPGKLADFIVIDQNPFSIPPMELKNIKVLATYLGGEQTFSDKKITS